MNEVDYSGHRFSCPLPRVAWFSEVIVRHVPADRPCRVLDIGCGSGDQIFHLASQMPHACFTGIDLSPESVSAAEEKRRSFPGGERISFTAGDYMEYRCEPFDVIISYAVLQLIPAPKEEIFEKLSRDLTAGGILALGIPYRCIYNTLLRPVRALFRLIRSPFADSIILKAASMLHPDLPESVIRERIIYMYITPRFFTDRRLFRYLESSLQLRLLEARREKFISIAKFRHQFAVFRKENGKS